MSSDADYMAFLDKVNAQRDGAQQAEYSTSTSKIRTETVHTGVSVPHSLQSISANFISETDELFEPVVLKWNEAKMGIWPDAGQFTSLITRSKDHADHLARSVTTLSENSFDPRNQYASVLRAVREAVSASASSGSGSAEEVKIYRVEIGASTVEYWVLALDTNDGRIVGVKAKAVET